MKKFIIGLCIVVAGMFTAGELLADEADVLPKSQQAVFVTAPDEKAPVDPTTNFKSHYLNIEAGRTLSFISYITPKTAVIKLFSGITVADFIKIHDDIRKLKDYTDIRDITLVVNSPGGSAFEGLSIASLILKARHEWGFTIRAEGFGIIASAAVPIYAVCSPRVAAPGTLIMVHEAVMWKRGAESASDMNVQQEMMALLRERYVQFLVDHTTTNKEDWVKMIKATTWMTPEDAKDLGLVDEVK